MREKHEKKEMKSKLEAMERGIGEFFDGVDNFFDSAKKLNAKIKKNVDEKIINKVKDIEMEALFTEIENLFDRVRKIDAKITRNVDGLFSKVAGYFRDSIDSYKKTRK